MLKLRLSLAVCIAVALGFGCDRTVEPVLPELAQLPTNVLDVVGTPESPTDRGVLAFSDQGAWFAYAMPDDPKWYGGFSGPFLMTQENGRWCSPALSQLEVVDQASGKALDWAEFEVVQRSYNSHLEQVYTRDGLRIRQTLAFASGQSASLLTELFNDSEKPLHLQVHWKGELFLEGLTIGPHPDGFTVSSNQSSAQGLVLFPPASIASRTHSDSSYTLALDPVKIAPGTQVETHLMHHFLFPPHPFDKETTKRDFYGDIPETLLRNRSHEKLRELQRLKELRDPAWKDSVYDLLTAKAALTLQNNWRTAAGELPHAGLFPSYHYRWFHGFWAWDSWKHAVALSRFHPELAKEQIQAMYAYMDQDGFIADCVFRDTTIERHNLRNTKPPLSAWAVWNVLDQTGDLKFAQAMYPRIKQQHAWWYTFRDHDQDSLCEYGSTDGTLIAAKWESGMDNGVRFDDATLLQNGPNAYSLDQESVDLNAYLYAEKCYLNRLAEALAKTEEAERFAREADALKARIQTQFFDPATGWFYDTTLDGSQWITVQGCEGWIPLWAGAATPEQAEAVKHHMMDTERFNTHVPFPTLSASHPAFEPDGGYWRGPNWLDQVYFGIQGLHNYGYHPEAYTVTEKLFQNAEGLLQPGPSIRENYHPLTGAGLEAENFSWSAAHVLLLLEKPQP